MSEEYNDNVVDLAAFRKQKEEEEAEKLRLEKEQEELEDIEYMRYLLGNIMENLGDPTKTGSLFYVPMSDEEYNKLVDQVDGFLRDWEKEYMKDKPNEPVQRKPYKPEVDDVLEYCSLDEIVDFLKDDPELTDEERFELYYDEREKRREKKSGMSYEQLLKKSGVLPPDKN